MRHPLHTAILSWAERSQQAACRNAMIATTLLNERRHERLEVEAYLHAFALQREAATNNLHTRQLAHA